MAPMLDDERPLLTQDLIDKHATEYIGRKAGDAVVHAYEVIARSVGINPLVVRDLGWGGKMRTIESGLVVLTADEVRRYLSELIGHCDEAIDAATERRDRLVATRDSVTEASR